MKPFNPGSATGDSGLRIRGYENSEHKNPEHRTPGSRIPPPSREALQRSPKPGVGGIPDRVTTALRRFRHPLPIRVHVTQGHPSSISMLRRGLSGGTVERAQAVADIRRVVGRSRNSEPTEPNAKSPEPKTVGIATSGTCCSQTARRIGCSVSATPTNGFSKGSWIEVTSQLPTCQLPMWFCVELDRWELGVDIRACISSFTPLRPSAFFRAPRCPKRSSSARRRLVIRRWRCSMPMAFAQRTTFS